MPPKSKKRGAAGTAAKQQRLTTFALPLLKNPMEVIGKQVGVQGAYWDGRLSAEEKKTEYMCSVVDYSVAHRFRPAEPPAAAFKMQEMGTTGTGSTEHGDSSGGVFWMPYPDPFLKYYYATFPEQMPSPEGAVSGPADSNSEEVEVKKEHAVEMHPSFPNMRLSSAPVFSNFTVESDKLVTEGPKSGQYAAVFCCNISGSDGHACGAKRTVYHKAGCSASSTNLINHLRDQKGKCQQHAAALAMHDAQSSNMVVIDGDTVVPVYKFSEAFKHHVDFLYLRSTGLFSQTLAQHDEFRAYVRGYDPRASFAHPNTIHRLADTINELQREERMSRIARMKTQYHQKPCVGIQLDMFTDSDTHTAFGCISFTTVEEPRAGMDDPQLYLSSEILEFEVFPFTSKTGANIRTWFLSSLQKSGIEHSMVAGISPDGAADGQCALGGVATLAEKVDTCMLHQLQRGVLYSTGIAGKTSRNSEVKALLRKHARVVMLTHQSGAVAKQIREMQTAAGVKDHELKATVKTCTTRWGNAYKQVTQNCDLRPAIDPTVDRYKRDHKGEKEAIIEVDEGDGASKVGTPVAAAELGLNARDWEQSQELEGFLTYPFQIKETIECRPYCTGAQGLALIYDLKQNFCNSDRYLEVVTPSKSNPDPDPDPHPDPDRHPHPHPHPHP